MFGKLCRKKEVPRTNIKFPKHVNNIPVEEAPSVHGFIASMRSAPKFPQKPPPGNISDELYNEASQIIDKLNTIGVLSSGEVKKLYKKYLSN